MTARSWREVDLGDVVEFLDYKRRPLNSTERAARKGPYPYYGASGPFDSVDDYLFDGRFLLVAEDGENLNSRKLPVAFFATGKFWVNNHAHIVRGRPGLADDEFLKHWFAGNSISGYITGAAQPKLSQASMKRIRLLLPSYGAQRRIASILSAYDDLIENNTRRIAILEEMARRIYEEWFVRFRFPGHEGVRMVASELGLAPEGWSVKTLQDIATITMGLSPKGDTYNDDADGTPLINGPVEFGERFTRQVKWTTAPTKLCGDGDLVVCVRGSTTGKYVKSDGVYCLGRGVCAIRSKFQGFVDQVFEHQLPTLLAQVGGSTFPSWTGPQLKLHPVLVPEGKLLAGFEAHVEPMRDAVRAYSRQIDSLRTTRDLLLPKLISGELDVSAMPEPEAIAA